MSPQAGNVRLGVTDNGRGMTRAIQRRALDLFFTTKPRSMGTGLGLPLVQKVAMRAGGEIEIKSEPEKGTTVVLVLPAFRPGKKTVTSRKPAKRVATISVRDHRTTELIAHVLLKAGLTLTAGAPRRPVEADFWVTDPTPSALALATKWRKRDPRRLAILLGRPRARSRGKWASLGALVIEPPDDFEAIRHTLGQALLVA